MSKLDKLIASDKYEQFVEQTSKFGIENKDVLNYYSGLLMHQLLDTFELFKKYLLTTLDKVALSLDGRESLGGLLYKIKKKG